MKEKSLLATIQSPRDIRQLDKSGLDDLCAEIRETLVGTISCNGGHLASNLGVVELTVAIHKSFNSPYDNIVWDVGHQSYTHKLLTGRFDRFGTIRQENGLSGYTRPDESEHDVFLSGHSGTGVSAGFGLAEAKLLKKDNSFVVVVIGDGSFTGGLAYEAINNAGRTDARLVVILNDNEMSISGNVGAFARYLTNIRSKPKYYRLKAQTESFLNHIPLIGKKLSATVFKIKTTVKNLIYPRTWFEEFGFRYIGPLDGHDISKLCQAFDTAKMIAAPVLIHVNTVKGKGYDHAERSPVVFHGISQFDIETGEPVVAGKSFSTEFGDYLCGVAAKDRRICAITAAMSVGTGLEKFRTRYPDRFFDVGIAEEHAVTFSSGLAKMNMVPVFAVYSTFLQRCYDQLIHDVSLQNLHLVLAVDRAGFVGEDGETHQGLFDVAMLNGIPNVTIYSPATFDELRSAMNNALYHDKGIVAVRYPRAGEAVLPKGFAGTGNGFDCYGDAQSPYVVVSYGRCAAAACFAADTLRQGGTGVSILKLNRIKPFDSAALDFACGKRLVIFFEEGIKSGGAGERFALSLLERGFQGKFYLKAIEDRFVPQAPVSSLLERFGFGEEGIRRQVAEMIAIEEHSAS